MVDNLELQLVQAWRRYAEHLAGKHNQKSHANRFGSPAALKANVKRLGKDKEALKRMAARARGDKDFQAKVKKRADWKKAQRSPSKQLVKSSMVSKLGYSGDDKIMGTDMTFRDVMDAIDQSVNVVTSVLPKMKVGGVNMKDAAAQSGGVFRKALRNRLGGKNITELNVMTTRNGKQAIGSISPQAINDIERKLQKYVEVQ